MEYRVENIISTLQGLPAPEYEGQILNLQIFTETWEIDIAANCEPCSAMQKLIVVKAAVFGRGYDSWLEWVYDV